ncbi:MAG: GH92 family glycosyl hydrolase [Myxococcota bacterium]|nr:GH92 family glycosyl hydrolase [Myxococcota bacterium]
MLGVCTLFALLLVGCETAQRGGDETSAPADPVDQGARVPAPRDRSMAPDVSASPRSDRGRATCVESVPIEAYDPLPLVDPFIGTGGEGAEIASVTPGASAPLGLTLTGPDTRGALQIPPYHCAGYHYPDTHILSFSHTHAHGMGVVDYGGIPVLPRAQWRPEYRTPRGREARFSHEEEWASPGRYGVRLLDDQTEVDIVATLHGAHHRLRFPDGAAPVLIIDLGQSLMETEVDEASLSLDLEAGALSAIQRVRGQYSQRFGGVRHFAALQLDPPPSRAEGWVGDEPIVEGLSFEGAQAGMVLHFPEGTREVDLRVALSFVDLDGAWGNLRVELPDRDWAARLDEVETRWRDRLKRVRARGSERDLRRFTTAHYHSLLMPSLNSDVDLRYRGLDQEIHSAEGPYYSDLSLWDTFRTLHSFYLLAHPELQRSMLQSLLLMVRDGGSLPRWPLAHGYTGGMVGTPAAQLFAEAYLKGLRGGWDEVAAFEAALAQARGEAADAGRKGVERYRSLGWVPADEESGSVSRTLEFAWSDDALARWAAAIGDPSTDELRALSQSWRNLWDAESGWMRGRNADGSWHPLPSENDWRSEFVEGNAWHYLWYVPYDVEGMIEVQEGGDRAAFLERYRAYWEGVFEEPDDLLPDRLYWHGNEPVLHYPWLGSLAGERSLTVELSHHVLETRYGHDPAKGLDGNDDSGTLSAWYLWAAMGLYPVAGTDLYALGAPIFERVEVGGSDEEAWVIEAQGAGWYRTPAGVIARGGEARFEGQLTHSELAAGLCFAYSPETAARE